MVELADTLGLGSSDESRGGSSPSARTMVINNKGIVMKVEQTAAEGLKHTFHVTVPAEKIEAKIQEYLTEYSKGLKVPGFREGKVPVSVVEARYGVKAQENALGEVIAQATDDLMDEHKLRQALSPKYPHVNFQRGQDLVFTMVVEVLPDFELKSFDKISLQRLITDVPEAEVETAMSDFCKDRIRLVDIAKNRPANDTDVVTVKMSLTVSGKVVPELNDQTVQIDLKNKDYIFPEIIPALIGASLEDAKSVDVHIGENFPIRKYAKKSGTLSVVLQKIQEAAPLEKNDDMAKEAGFETLDALKAEFKDRISKEFESLSRLLLKRRILDNLAETYNFDVPASMLESEFDFIWKRLQSELEAAKAQGQVEDEEDINEAELEKEYREIAERRVRLGILISEIGVKHNIHLSEEEARAVLIREALRYRGREREVLNYYRRNEEARDRLLAPALEDKVVDFIASGAKVEEKTVDFSTFKKEVKAVVPHAFPDDEVESQDEASKPKAAAKAKSSEATEDKPKKAAPAKKAAAKKA